MSVVFQADVFCDACGDWIQTDVSGKKASGLASRALKFAKKTGWSRQTNSLFLDVCPTCLSKIRRGETKP